VTADGRHGVVSKHHVQHDPDTDGDFCARRLGGLWLQSPEVEIAPTARETPSQVILMPRETRLGNFDTIRLIAAGSVIFSHAFLLAEGHDGNEPFKQLTGSILGINGVFVFLIISGFLVTQSLFNSSSLWHFAWKRFLRIYPALAIYAVVAAALIAPFFTTAPLREYVSSLAGVKYAVKVLLLFPHAGLPVQFYQGSLGDFTNGSLWTISAEIYCYALLFAVAMLGLVSLRVALIGLLIGTAAFVLWNAGLITLPVFLGNLSYVVPSFCAGAAMYFINGKYGLSGRVGLASAVGLALFIPTGHFLEASPILAAYPIIYLGMAPSIGNTTKLGDLSYGTYLYGWPVEQVVRSMIGPTSGWTLFLISLPIAMACGWLSWHLVEKRAMRLKNYFRSVRVDPVSLHEGVNLH
jgi:peptidoglycan/LPS O-acetylase OafA/YrhL